MPLDLANTGTTQTTAPAAQPANVPSPFTFTEDITSGALSVTLEDTDLPHGRARELAAFQSGGSVDIAQGGVYNPGSERVVLQMMAVRENLLTIKGAFRDRIRAGAQRQVGGREPNHAKYMRDLVERIRRRRNPLKITWDGDERTGVLKETSFDEEGPHDIAYTLTFFIAVPPTGVNETVTSPTNPTPSLEDLRSQMSADLAQRRADMLLLATNAAAVAALSNALGFVQNAIETLGTFTTTLERAVLSTPAQIGAAVNNVQSSAQAVQTQVESIRDAGYDQIPPSQAMIDQSIDAFMQWWAWQSQLQLTLDQTVDAMRQIRLQSGQQLRKATKLYRVQDGDTLESIALTQLGSRARAADLGVRPDQLVPGSYVRIPQAT